MTRDEFKMATFGIRYGNPQNDRARAAWRILAVWPLDAEVVAVQPSLDNTALQIHVRQPDGEIKILDAGECDETHTQSRDDL